MKHNYTIAQIIFGWIIIFGSYYTGQWVVSDSHEDELERIINWNTKQIHSLGIAAATDSYNADLMIQILNLKNAFGNLKRSLRVRTKHQKTCPWLS